jgi:hypothetical protein
MNPYNDLDYQQLQEVEAKLAGKTEKPGGAMTIKEGQATQKKYEADLLKSKEPPPPPPPKEEAPKQEKPFNPYAIDSGYKARPETDAEEKMARFDKLYGEDPAKERLTKRLTKMEERAAREEAQSPWMAITRAGLKTLAGTSPFAAVNVGAGAVEGLESYAASQDRLAKMEDKRMDIDSRLAEAERAKKLAAVQYGVNSEEYANAYKDNNVFRYDENTDTYIGRELPELVIQGKPKEKGFWSQYADNVVKEHQGDGPLGAIIGTPLDAVLGLPSKALMLMFLVLIRLLSKC